MDNSVNHKIIKKKIQIYSQIEILDVIVINDSSEPEYINKDFMNEDNMLISELSSLKDNITDTNKIPDLIQC